MATGGLRALLARVIDYAGLFPPAQLPLDQALRQYLRHRDEPEGWMLGRFVCPAARLAEPEPFVTELAEQDRLFIVSALGRGGNTTAEVLAGLDQDLRDIAAFRSRHGRAVEVDVYEVRLPPDVLAGDGMVRLLGEAARRIEEAGPPVLKPFYEVPLRPGWRDEVPPVLAAVAEEERESAPRFRQRPAGIKLRTGGLEAAAFPSPEQVAFVLATARRHELALKFTAGLHHPVRRFDPGVGAFMHGFLNVFVAGVLAWEIGLVEEALLAVLADTDGKFVFDEGEVGWDTYGVGLAQVHHARMNGVLSFGSCSFDEPRDDLRALGLL